MSASGDANRLAATLQSTLPTLQVLLDSTLSSDLPGLEGGAVVETAAPVILGTTLGPNATTTAPDPNATDSVLLQGGVSERGDRTETGTGQQIGAQSAPIIVQNKKEESNEESDNSLLYLIIAFMFCCVVIALAANAGAAYIIFTQKKDIERH